MALFSPPVWKRQCSNQCKLHIGVMYTTYNILLYTHIHYMCFRIIVSIGALWLWIGLKTILNYNYHYYFWSGIYVFHHTFPCCRSLPSFSHSFWFFWFSFSRRCRLSSLFVVYWYVHYILWLLRVGLRKLLGAEEVESRTKTPSISNKAKCFFFKETEKERKMPQIWFINLFSFYPFNVFFTFFIHVVVSFSFLSLHFCPCEIKFIALAVLAICTHSFHSMACKYFIWLATIHSHSTDIVRFRIDQYHIHVRLCCIDGT